jgi:hypothetical protein
VIKIQAHCLYALGFDPQLQRSSGLKVHNTIPRPVCSSSEE